MIENSPKRIEIGDKTKDSRKEKLPSQSKKEAVIIFKERNSIEKVQIKNSK